MGVEIILQVLSGKEYETLEVYESGRIICTCLNGLFNKDRDVNSTCRHANQLREDICKNTLEKYVWVKS